MDDLDGCMVGLEHAMLEFLRRETVEGFVKGRWVDLRKQLLKALRVFFMVPFFVWLRRDDGGDESDEEGDR